MSPRPQGGDELIHGQPGAGGAAHEHVQRGKAGFGPGVDADVRFLQEQHAGHALAGAEEVEMAAQRSGAGAAGRGLQTGFKRSRVRQGAGGSSYISTSQ